MAEHNIPSDTVVATLTTTLSAAAAEVNLNTRMKQADTWANRMLDDSVKFAVGLTDVGECLEEARVAAPFLTCLADRMRGIIAHAWV